MRLYKRHGVYHVTYQSRGGKQVRRSLKTSEKRIAEQRAAKLELTIHEAQLRRKLWQVTCLPNHQGGWIHLQQSDTWTGGVPKQAVTRGSHG